MSWPFITLTTSNLNQYFALLQSKNGGGPGMANIANLLSFASATYASSVSASPSTSNNNYAPSGYTGGTTNRLLLFAASGGSTLTGLSSSGVPDGFGILMRNTSTTDIIYLSHLSSSSSAANQFSCPAGGGALGQFDIPPLTNCLLTYVINIWTITP